MTKKPLNTTTFLAAQSPMNPLQGPARMADDNDSSMTTSSSDATSSDNAKPDPSTLKSSRAGDTDHPHHHHHHHHCNHNNNKKLSAQLNELTIDNSNYSLLHPYTSSSSPPPSYFDEHDDEEEDIPVTTQKVQHSVPDFERQSPPSSEMPLSERVETIAASVRTILHCLGDDPCRHGLQKTPERYAKALLALTEGYSQSLEQIVNNAKFQETPSESVLVRNIDVFSLCEHHLLPFHGWCHVAYLPNAHVIGLSKVARIVNMYARRLQVQERLTAQIADAVEHATQAHGVMVFMTCTHMCMSMRGVQKVSAETSTTVTRGKYAKDPHLRAEFLASINCKRSL